jgi:hypothetical protein
LLEFYWSLDGQLWENNEGWEIFDVMVGKYEASSGAGFDKIDIPFANVEYCSFHGIICDIYGHVNVLTLSNNRLHGTMPSNILTLPKLESLDLP